MLKKLLAIIILLTVISQAQAYEKKEPWLAAGLSILIPGLGQCYNGDYWKGALWFVDAVGSASLMYIEDVELEYDPWTDSWYVVTTYPYRTIGALLYLTTIIACPIFAAIDANKINKGGRFGLEFKPQKNSVKLALSYKF